MTTDPTDEKLDRLLQDWSTKSASYSQLNVLEQRILASLRNSGSAARSVGDEVSLRASNAGAEASRSVVPARSLTGRIAAMAVLNGALT